MPGLGVPGTGLAQAEPAERRTNRRESGPLPAVRQQRNGADGWQEVVRGSRRSGSREST